MLRRSIFSGSVSSARAFAIPARSLHTTPVVRDPPNKPEEAEPEAGEKKGLLGVSGKVILWC